MNDSLKKRVILSFIWKFLERGGTQGIQFLLQIFLARLLTPKDYGTIAIITVFIAVANVFVQSGFNTALIQKRDIDEKDYSSVFYLSLLVSGILYVFLWFLSPKIALFYQINDLIWIIRVLAVTLFFGAFNSIQNAIVSRNMEFKKLFYGNFGAVLISGFTSLVLAYQGFGVWALVFQQLINQISSCVILWYVVKWHPKLVFSLKNIKKLFSFGGKLLCSSLIDTLYRELTNLIVGKKYSPTMLGYYNRGTQFPQVIVGNFNGAIQSVLFPALSLLQGETEKLKQVMRRGIVTSSYIIFPCMLGLALVGESLVKVVLTDKWLPCVPYLRIFCFAYMLWPIHTANLQAINAVGRSDIFLKLEIIKKIIGLSIILITYRYSPFAMAVGVLVSGVISSFINAYPNKKLLNYSYFEQLRDIYPAFFLALVMGILIYFINYIKISNILILVLQIILGMIIYIILSYVTKNETFIYLFNIIKGYMIKRRN